MEKDEGGGREEEQQERREQPEKQGVKEGEEEKNFLRCFDML